MFIVLITLFVLLTLVFGLAAAALLTDAFRPRAASRAQGTAANRCVSSAPSLSLSRRAPSGSRALTG